MQLKILNRLIALTAVVLLTASGSIAKPNSFKDERDGQVYKTVKIGKQVWMAENLKYKSKDSYCYDDETTNCKKYGRLYTWEAAKRACPAGYHLPSNAEWDMLLKFMSYDNNLITTDDAGAYLKSKTGWGPDDEYPAGTDKYGFNGLPAGRRDSDGSYNDMGDDGRFWSSTEDTSSYSDFYSLDYSNDALDHKSCDKTNALSVRCLNDSLEEIVIEKYFNPDIDYETFKDERDGQSYKTVQIGSQTWMAENLNYETEESVCYGDIAINCKKYSRLYTWEDAKSACPAGYHLPSNAEWYKLLKFVLADNNLGSKNEAGTYLKSKTGCYPDDEYLAGTDKYGFNGLPAGYRFPTKGSYYGIGRFGHFWSSTENSTTYEYFYSLRCNSDGLNREYDYDKSYARSVRCLKNSN